MAGLETSEVAQGRGEKGGHRSGRALGDRGGCCPCVTPHVTPRPPPMRTGWGIPPAEVGPARVAPVGVSISPPAVPMSLCPSQCPVMRLGAPQCPSVSPHVPPAALSSLVTQLQALGAAILGDDGDPP